MPDKVTKFINALDKKTRARIKKKLLELRMNPYQMKEVKKVKKLKGRTSMYRLRLGKIRIVYQILEDQSIEIIDIDYRGNIY